MDAGCEYHGYASDITRTWPVSGKFSDPQRELYELVLRVHKKCLKVRLITCLKHSLTQGQFKCEKLDERSLFDFLVPSFVKRMFHWTIYITPCCYFWERNLLVSEKKCFRRKVLFFFVFFFGQPNRQCGLPTDNILNSYYREKPKKGITQPITRPIRIRNMSLVLSAGKNQQVPRAGKSVTSAKRGKTLNCYRVRNYIQADKRLVKQTFWFLVDWWRKRTSWLARLSFSE